MQGESARTIETDCFRGLAEAATVQVAGRAAARHAVDAPTKIRTSCAAADRQWTITRSGIALGSAILKRLLSSAWRRYRAAAQIGTNDTGKWISQCRSDAGWGRVEYSDVTTGRTVMASKKRTVKLVVSADKKPAVKVKPGTQLQVVAVKMLNPANKRPRALGARLCGGSGTCIALVDV
jgi:hypothetical protein